MNTRLRRRRTLPSLLVLLATLVSGCTSITTVADDPEPAQTEITDQAPAAVDETPSDVQRRAAQVEARVGAAVEWILARLREQEPSRRDCLDEAATTMEPTADTRRQ